MTTREFTPRLDRQISREVTTTVEVSASTAYAYDTQELQTGDRVSDGAWRRDSDTELAIGLNDSNGLSFPDLTTPTSGVEVAFDGAAATTLTITDMGFLRNPFGQILGIQLTFDGPLPAAGAMLTIMIPTGGTQTVTQTVQRPVWAQRRDFSGRDFSQVVQGGLITIRDTRYIVRTESGPWAAGDTFTDEDGETLSVQGVQQIGRGYLELLARSGGL